MIEKFNGIFYLIVFLVHFIIFAAYAYQTVFATKKFLDEFAYYCKHWIGRPSPIYFAERLTKKIGGAKIYFKQEHLNHTGSHKPTNTLFQVLLAKRMGKKKIICESGAGQHWSAAAATAA